MGIKITQRGDFSKTEHFLINIPKKSLLEILDNYGRRGVQALSAATPQEHGATAAAWYYEIVHRPGYVSLRWHNSNVVGRFPVAILIQYGHATRGGGYVQGRDYIMPAIVPIFDQILDECWKEVTGNGDG